MEHLALPKNATRTLPVVRYLCDEPRDNGPFLEYLDRNPDTMFSTKEEKGIITEDEICRHYQTWLFFGLLEEFFGSMFRSHRYEYYDPELELHALTTRDFYWDLIRWKRERLRQIQDEDPHFTHFAKCLDEVLSVLRTTSWSFPGYGEELGALVDIIASVAEALECTISEADEEFGRPVTGRFGGGRNWLNASHQKRPDILKQCKDLMQKEGWCPNDISRAEDKFHTCEAWHYLRHMKMDNDPTEHVRCDTLFCRAANGSGVRRPKHIEPDCSCASFEANSQDLTESYLAGKLPCLKLSCKGKFEATHTHRRPDKLEIALETLPLEHDSTQPYIAISHVANGGTGNSEDNSLPKCQLFDMWLHAEAWRDAVFPELVGKPVNIWIDTICCPCKPGRGKDFVLSQMKKIYNNALFVLVIDRTLIEWDTSGADLLEYLVRLFFSPWMRRLWTAQEAIFAGLRPRGTVVVQFGDEAHDWTTIYIEAVKRGRKAERFAFDLSREFIWLEKGLWFGDGDSPPLANLRTIAHVLQYRSTTVAADEALVLGNLLRFPVKQFIGLTQEAAMCRFWEEVSNVKFAALPDEPLLQKQVVFCPVPRLCTPGFRWAPRSFLNTHATSMDHFFAFDTLKYSAQLTSRGLKASYPSLRLLPPAAEHTFCLFGDGSSCIRGADALMAILPDGSCVMTQDWTGDPVVHAVGSRELLWQNNLCLLTHSAELPLERTYTYALWVHLEEERDGVKYGRILEPTAAAKAQPNSVQLATAAKDCCFGIIHELQQIDTDGSLRDLDLATIKEVSDHRLPQYLRENPTLLDVIKKDTRSSVHDRQDYTFDDCLRSLTTMVHYYGHLGDIQVEVYPNHAVWCLD